MTEPELAGLELELRQLPGVVGVGLDSAGGTLVVHLYLSPDAAAADVRRRASEVARGHVDDVVAIEVEEAGQDSARAHPGASRERVRFLAVRVTEGEVEAHLSRTGVRSVGRADEGGRGAVGAQAAANATIDALRGLGLDVPYEISVLAQADYGLEHVVAVVLMPTSPGSEVPRRMGIAAGTTPEESACRATLNALNRLLEARPEAVEDAAASIN